MSGFSRTLRAVAQTSRPGQQFPPVSTDSRTRVSQQSLMPFGGRVLRSVAAEQDAQPPVVAPASSSGLFSLTYEPYYGLKEKAFSLSADPRFLFRSPEHAPAFEELLNGIRRREGLITLTGEIGTGKTTLIRSVLQQLDRRTFSAFLPDPFVSREDLLKMLLVDFGVVSVADLKRGILNGASRPDLSYPLYEFLDSLVPLQAFAVLIIDEAQNLPLPLLEEVRILSDLEGREKLLQVVLVGQPELRDHLRLPEMRQVNQRVSVRCELTPLKREGVADYIQHRLLVASEGSAHVEFAREAIDAIYEGSRGTPRLINLLCDRALLHGFNARVTRIDPNLVWDAMGDLGLEIDAAESEAPAPPAMVSTRGPSKTPAVSVPIMLAAAPKASTVPPAEPAISAAVTRSASPVPKAARDRELLSDFAPESTDQSATDEGIGRGWMLVVAAVLLALIALGTMFGYARVQAASDVPDLRFPAAPTKVVATLPTIVPHFAIQVASFQTLARAERLAQELTNTGYDARAIELNLGQSGRIVAVMVGDYATEQDATRDLTALRSRLGFSDARVEPFVTIATR
jgi:general secretion pathway protein A